MQKKLLFITGILLTSLNAHDNQTAYGDVLFEDELAPEDYAGVKPVTLEKLEAQIKQLTEDGKKQVELTESWNRIQKKRRLKTLRTLQEIVADCHKLNGLAHAGQQDMKNPCRDITVQYLALLDEILEHDLPKNEGTQA